VPSADDPGLAIGELAVRIEPTPENGCAKPCHALAHHVTTASKRRITATPSHVTDAQLAHIRRLIALAIGVETAAT
jgi:mRNA interferase MazF